MGQSMNELSFAEKEKLRIAEGLAWYAAVEKEVRRIARAAAQKKENKCKKAKVSKSATCSQ